MVNSTTLINTFSKSALVYEGYITIKTGTDPNLEFFRLDQLMELSIDTVTETVSHFNSSKVKHNVVIGNNSVVILSLKDTVDVYEKSGNTAYLLNNIIKELNNELRVVPIIFRRKRNGNTRLGAGKKD